MRKNPHGSSWSLTVCIFLGFYSFHDWCLFPPKANEKPAWKFFRPFLESSMCCKEEADIIWPNKNTTQNNPKKQKKRKRKIHLFTVSERPCHENFFPCCRFQWMIPLPSVSVPPKACAFGNDDQFGDGARLFSCPYKRELQRLECIFRNGIRKKRDC